MQIKNASLKEAVFEQAGREFRRLENADVDGADFTTLFGFTDATLNGAKNVEKAVYLGNMPVNEGEGQK